MGMYYMRNISAKSDVILKCIGAGHVGNGKSWWVSSYGRQEAFPRPKKEEYLLTTQ